MGKCTSRRIFRYGGLDARTSELFWLDQNKSRTQSLRAKESLAFPKVFSCT